MTTTNALLLNLLNPALLLLVFSLINVPGAAGQLSGQEIQFIEEFALSEDREEALQQLIPGTEEYFYFHCLHFQNTEQLDKVDEMLTTWIRRHGRTQPVQQIENRQALLKYEHTPKETLEYLRKKLNLPFDHQRELPRAERDLPAKLDSRSIRTTTLLQRALEARPNTDGFEQRGLSLLVGQDLSKTRLRHLLQRIEYPDVDNLPELIAKDLTTRDARPFGSYGIHRKLTRRQLDQLLSLRPELLNQQEFIDTYLAKLRPSDDVLWRADEHAYAAYLRRLWDFVKNLGSTHNSLKTSVLYRQLRLNLRLGKYDKELFVTYLKLPRRVGYINPQVIKQARSSQNVADLNANFEDAIALPPIGRDEPLVRHYLAHFLKPASNYEEFLPWIDDDYLKRLFAETKLVNGLGDKENWASLLTPQQYKALLNRVDLDFAKTSPRFYDVEDPVELTAFTKNVEKLIVKIFEINTENYYRDTGEEINTDVNLDGLVPNWEETYNYDDPPLLRVKRDFKFDQLDEKGVYVIDFIGNGKSSRALIRKGELHHVVQTTAAGHVFAVFDGDNQPVKDAHIWMAGHQYQAKENGLINIPFSTQPKRQKIVIGHGVFHVLDSFQHVAENYKLNAGIYIDREDLLQTGTAKVVIRPQLRINGIPAPLKLLEDVRFTLKTMTLDETTSSKDFKDLKLDENGETVVEFRVPNRLRTVTGTLQAMVENISKSEEEDLQTSQTFAVNEIDKGESISQIHFVKGKDGYRLEVRGKTGELRKHHAVLVRLKHKYFKEVVQQTLQTDEKGRIQLGELPLIAWLEVQTANAANQKFYIRNDRNHHYSTVHGRAGGELAIPMPISGEEVSSKEYALFEMRAGTIAANRFDQLAASPGLLRVQGLEPGDYKLVVKSTGREIGIRITDGKRSHGYALGEYRKIELRGKAQAYVREVHAAEDAVVIQLGNTGKDSRVHVFATRMVPRFDAFHIFQQVHDAQPGAIWNGFDFSSYIIGRDIGDEYRYILDRKYAEKYAGNMLTRPSMLLNPWALRETESTVQPPESGEEFSKSEKGAESESELKRAVGPVASSSDDPSSLDFLAEDTVSLLNLRPDKNGEIRIAKSDFGNKHYLQIIVDDSIATAVRYLTLPEKETKIRDLRLTDGMDPEQHFTQSKETTQLSEGDEFVLQDPLITKFQQIDDLSDVYRLYVSLTGNGNLQKFSFILDWPHKDQEEKRELYSGHACHELNLFLWKKDPGFFQEVVLPYLKHKRDKTFIDYFLIGEAVEKYAETWQFEKLNIAEQVFLSKAMENRRADLVRHIQDQYSMSPTDPTKFDRLFSHLFETGALDEAGLQEKLDRERSAPLVQNWGDMDGPAAPSKGGELANRQESGQDKGALLGGTWFGEELDKLQTQRRSRIEDARASSGEREVKEREETTAADARMDPFHPNLSLTVTAEQQLMEGVDVDGLRELQRLLFRRLEPTKEWAENNYYELPIAKHTPGRVQVNRFWRDYAQHESGHTFLSPYFAESAGNFTEMMLAMAVLDLPFEAPEHKIDLAEDQLKFTAAGNVIAFYQEIQPAVFERRGSTVLISENFFRNDDRYRQEGDRRFDKFITDEFLTNVLYGGQVVITNPTSTPQTIELLLQIPEGALPANGSKQTRSKKIDLGAFSTQTLDYHFYFPAKGNFEHYPAHVSQDDRVVAVADSIGFKVVETPSKIDRTSWAYISQNGSDQEVLDFLENENLLAVDLSRIAFRMKDRAFFNEATRILKNRFVFEPVLWSYSIHHNETHRIREFLARRSDFLQQLGGYIDTKLAEVNPVERYWYEHREYWPLVNARAHQLGDRRRILNSAFYQQYHRLMHFLAARPELNSYDELAVTYYLLLQDRVSEALDHFAQVNADELNSRLQYDYCAAYLAMYQEKPDEALSIAQSYLDHPVDRWRERFERVADQVVEVQTGEVVEADGMEDPRQKQAALAAQSPSFEFKVEAGEVVVNYQNLSKLTVNYYLMDIELLFSRNPFVQQQTRDFSFIRPNSTDTIKLDAEKSEHRFEIPDELDNQNVLVEISSGEQAESQAYYANSLDVQIVENYGQLRVRDSGDQSPLSKVYVKVYGRNTDGTVHFYKDGYTDLRGWFDYVSVSNQQLEEFTHFAILVLSDDHGAIIREAIVPKE